MVLYSIKNSDGTISQQQPIDGAWYCHFVIKPDGSHVDGNIGQCHYIDDQTVEFLDDDGEWMDMFSDDYPCYIVKQS